ncbi:origin recognition complex subunit 3 N-terminus-domain-containing protein [Flagelloscypha sp. PMI_526]|nr:origin recognition complex subunit 3 N-terminus-domain-containing protein [Flagelloscypha sp. PMI_526]
MSESVSVIPFSGDDQSEIDLGPSLFQIDSSDLPDGPLLRWEAYRNAWSKCLGRIRDILDEFLEPIALDALSYVEASRSNLVPTPQAEIPVLCLHNSGGGSSFSTFVLTQVEAHYPLARSCHIHPEDCSSLTALMRALITGILASESRPNRATSLTNYDIRLLEAWFRSKPPEQSPEHLFIILHDFELIPVDLMQDFFQICRSHATKLPFLFIFLMESPPITAYMHASYSRAALSCLRLKHASVPPGPELVEFILSKLFFQPDWSPNIVLGPSAIDFVGHNCRRKNPTIDGFITTLQLCHLKHFANEPFSCLIGVTPPLDVLASEESSRFMNKLLSRIHAPSAGQISPSHAADWQEESIESLINTVNSARENFQRHVTAQRIAFRLHQICYEFLHEFQKECYIRLPPQRPLFEIMSLILKGEFAQDIGSLCSGIGQLSPLRLKELLERVRSFLILLPDEIRDDETIAIEKITELLNGFDGGEKKATSRTKKWFNEYFSELVTPLDSSDLWEIWYTRNSAVPDELFDPSFRSIILTGLGHPQEHTSLTSGNVARDPDILDLPDTNILFRRYLDSGKSINVYDLFESFQSTLEAQHAKRSEPRQQQRNQSSPTKRPKSPQKSKRSKSPQKKRIQASVDEEGHHMEDLPPLTQDQTHARFLRAFQELDLIGFFKHGGRKADHVQRTVFDIIDVVE